MRSANQNARRMPGATPERRYLNVLEAAAYLGVSRSHLYKLMNAGYLPYHVLGGPRRLKIEALDDYARKCELGGTRRIGD